MTPHADVIIVGLGTAGASTCMTLARRGVRVLGLDAFHPPHDRGSHHGRSRSVRRAYLEGTGYLPMALRAWALWRRLEHAAGERLLIPTGNLTLGPPDGPALSGFLASARAAHIDHRLLSAAEVRKRWPVLHPPDHFAAGLETTAGIVFPETAVRLFLQRAAAAGAVLHFDEPVVRWVEAGTDVAVVTTQGRYTAGRVLIAAGARGGPLWGRTAVHLAPKRVAVHWIDPPDPAAYAWGRLPVNFWQVPNPPGTGITAPFHEFYTLPALAEGGRVKAAFHHPLADADPFRPPPAVTAAETSRMRNTLQRFLPALADRTMHSDTCLYALTPDHHFVLGALPENGNVFVVALAGHGFKFAPVVGELLAEMILGHRPSMDVAAFSPRRLAAPA